MASSSTLTAEDEQNLNLAIAQAEKSLNEGGIPIGAVMYGIPRVVFAENKNFVGGENLLLAPPSPPLSASYARPRILINASMKRAEDMMGDWIKSEAGANVWWEDIGQVGETR
ncbi:hypothetical protein FRB96_009536 [Tulasnella sp. 330]|nr:hypothetical protein FRB96_009536 [Tulasnella sp. 330]KAG8870387.1 hypothetical protein FRB97_009802 [Tulasnella sp. 331]